MDHEKNYVFGMHPKEFMQLLHFIFLIIVIIGLLFLAFFPNALSNIMLWFMTMNL